ncbi:DUF427 domain-containing protein [Paraburkholderia phosphatilytica]|uniref:DUF427 domain-containing protein n=1 Tax=Paraburkholderia phosphatilytica TaxID=2282883 RepID=UPI000E4C8AB3|nr:DUF427 domain-containing protein [Paraburkholderia phosphatilytica]
MTERVIKQPNADHPITIEPTRHRVVVRFAGHVIADTTNAVTVREASYPPVQYIPRADIDFSVLTPTDHETYCPYKGECSYHSIEVGEQGAENAVWAYADPYPALEQIRDHFAFYPNKVTIEESAR